MCSSIRKACVGTDRHVTSANYSSMAPRKQHTRSCIVEFRCLKVVNPMSYLTVGSLENTSRLVDVSLNWTINSTG